MMSNLPVLTSSAANADRDEIPGSTIRFFLSSTFADFQTERDVLQRRVFPELRALCVDNGFRFEPIDLRWGVSEAAGTDRQTLRICFDELERCRALSPDFFLMIQLGNRYGSHILPSQVSSALIERLLPALGKNERRAFEAAYRLDENAVPPEYVLLRPSGNERDQDQALRVALVRAGQLVRVPADELLVFAGSATHREIQLGLLGQPATGPAASGVLCAVRTFRGNPRGAAVDRFVERDPAKATQVKQVTNKVVKRLPSKQVLRYTVDWWSDQGPAFDEDAIAHQYFNLLQGKLLEVLTKRFLAQTSASNKGHGKVARANAAFESERAAHVTGRDAELARLASHLAGETGDNVPLLVTGAPGSGKSALLAAAATRAAVTHPNATLIKRYIGVTPFTDSLSAFLNDLRRAIARNIDLLPITDEDELVRTIATDLATLQVLPEQPILFVIDALEQLDTRVQRIDWFPPRLAPHVRMIISVSSDRPELDRLRAQLPPHQVLALAPLGQEAGRAMIQTLLAQTPRRALTPSQEAAVLEAFSAQGLPLHLRLAATEARRWRSFDEPPQGAAALQRSTPELLNTILDRLEAPEQNGRALVERSLSYLALAYSGLTQEELLELLARDAAVRETQQSLSPSSPPIDAQQPLPMVLWARLHADLRSLLSEHEDDDRLWLYTFYTPGLRKVVEARYMPDPAASERRGALAGYFASQPWRVGGWRWNWRKVRELMHQFEDAGNRTAAEQALNSLVDDLQQVRTFGAEPEHRSQRMFIGGGPEDPELLMQRSANHPEEWDELLRVFRNYLSSGGYSRVEERLDAWLLDLSRSHDNSRSQVGYLLNLGLEAIEQERDDQAQGYFEEALAIAREEGDRDSEGVTLEALGKLADLQGYSAEAASYYEQALAIKRELGDRASEGSILYNLGVLAGTQGHSTEAAKYYEQALAIQREINDRADEGITLTNLGALEWSSGHDEEARGYYEQALAILQEIGDRAGEGRVVFNLGVVAANLGQKKEARHFYEQALAVLQEIGDRAGEGNSLFHLGALEWSLGHDEEARGYYEQALAVYTEIGALESEPARSAAENLRALNGEETRPTIDVATTANPKQRRWPWQPT